MDRIVVYNIYVFMSITYMYMCQEDVYVYTYTVWIYTVYSLEVLRAGCGNMTPHVGLAARRFRVSLFF